MSSDSSLYSPLLERLKLLQASQKQWKVVSNDLLSTIKRSPNVSENQSSLGVVNIQERPSQSGEVQLLKNYKTLQNNDLCSSSSTRRTSTVVRSGVQVLEDKLFDPGLEDKENTPVEGYSLYGVASFENLGTAEKNVSEKNMNSKFSYLRKGEGISRYKMSRFKGFKRVNTQAKAKKGKEKPNPKFEVPQQTTRLSGNLQKSYGNCSEADNNQVQNDFMVKKVSNFEKLEELIDRDSFCSTSSKVAELLHEESSCCSTPMASRILITGTQELTPTRRDFSNGDILKIKMSPNRKLFPNSQSPLNSSLSFPYEMVKYFPNNFETKTQSTNQMSEINEEWPKDAAFGILKRDGSTSFTPTTLKVKFLEKGAKVLEYENDRNERQINSLAAQSDESDLISVSDLENLALLNYNVNVVYENTLTDEESLLDSDDNKNRNNGDKITKSIFNSNRNFPGSSKILGCERFTEDSLDIKTHKALLLSKVYDLNKEIETFESKNKTLEDLIVELENKKKLLESQKQSQESNISVKNLKLKKKLVSKTSTGFDDISSQVKELHRKLQNLEIENSRLRVKVVTLEKSQRELNKKKIQTTKAASTGNKVPYKVKDVQPKSRVIAKDPLKVKSKNTNFMRENPPNKMVTQVSPQTLEVKDDDIPNFESANELPAVIEGRNNNKLKDLGTGVEGNEYNPLICSDKLKTYSGLDSISNCIDEQANCVKARHSLSIIYEENIGERSKNCVPDNSGVIIEGNINISDEVEDGMKLLSSHSEGSSIEIIDVPCRTLPVCENKDSQCVEGKTVQHPNGDKEIIYPDRIVYHYAQNNAIHTIFKDNSREEIAFSDGQREIYFQDKSYQLIFPDNSSKSVYKDGSEICVWKDGTVVRSSKDGVKCVYFPNGQKEIHDSESVHRIYLDGTTKILYSDGRQETRYQNGKVRIKDSEGNVTMYRMH